MTYEEIKELLRNVRSKKSRLKAIQTYINEEQELMRGVRGMDFDSTRVVTTPINHNEERYVKHLDRILKWQELYDTLFDEMCREEDLLSELMKVLSPTEYEVILNRYMAGISRKKTAEIMNITEDGIKKSQSRAIKKMEKFGKK